MYAVAIFRVGLYIILEIELNEFVFLIFSKTFSTVGFEINDAECSKSDC